MYKKFFLTSVGAGFAYLIIIASTISSTCYGVIVERGGGIAWNKGTYHLFFGDPGPEYPTLDMSRATHDEGFPSDEEISAMTKFFDKTASWNQRACFLGQVKLEEGSFRLIFDTSKLAFPSTLREMTEIPEGCVSALPTFIKLGAPPIQIGQDRFCQLQPALANWLKNRNGGHWSFNVLMPYVWPGVQPGYRGDVHSLVGFCAALLDETVVPAA